MVIENYTFDDKLEEKIDNVLIETFNYSSRVLLLDQ